MAEGPASKAEHLVVRVRVDTPEEDVRWNTVVLPDVGLIQGDDGTWMSMSAEARKAYLGLTADRTAFPASKMPVGSGLAEVEPRQAPAPAPAIAPADDSPAWPWIPGAAVALAALGAVALARRRRGSGAGAARIRSA